MNPFATLSLLARRSLALVGLLGFAVISGAQTSSTGTIEGRVFDAARSEYLEKARLILEGTAQETFTDAIGHYRFTQVPAGTVKIRVTFTGMAAQIENVTVEPGKTAQHDITLRSSSRPGATGDDTVKLGEFVVATSRNMDAASIAINEQRYASNIANVVSADEFGVVVDGTPGEVMKFLPGVTMEYSAGEARTISINGVSAAYVPVTIDGADVASTAGGTSRAVSLDSVSVNNLSRVEVLQSPTPESQGSALAGSVNMVSRSAFERSRPEFHYSIGLTMKDSERDFEETPGPMFTEQHKVTPAVNLSAIVPVNKRFGFTFSFNTNRIYQKEDWSQNSWMGARWATNGTTRPHTTPDNPYLIEYRIHDSTRMSRSTSAGTTFDYRISNNDRISLSVQYTFLGVTHNNRRLDFLANAVDPGNFAPTWMHGRAGAGEVRISSQTGRDWLGTTVVSSLAYRHNGPIWKAEAGSGFSRQALHTRDIDKGHFNAVQARRTGVTIDFDDIYYLQPGRISVRDAATGQPVDIYNLDNYSLANANSDPRDGIDAKQSVYANLKRDFDVRGLPLTLKAGVDFRRAMRDSDGPGASTYNFRGADNRASTIPTGNDDAAGIVLDESFSTRTAPFGFGRVPWINNKEYWDLYKAHPEWFAAIDENARYRSGVSNSKHAEELVSSGYIRGDLAFVERRLRFTGGVRAEQTNIKAEGPLTDPTRNFRRDANGNVIDGNPNQAGTQPVPIIPTTDALGVSQLTFIKRGQRTEKEYLRWFPSINVGYNIRENLIARAAYYYSVGRPDFNQYAGGLTLPDLTLTPNNSNASRITVNNAGIKAWSAKSAKVRLEYYFERGGQVSIGAFRRDFTNLFENTTFLATPDFLALYGLDQETYGGYEVVTQRNLSTQVRMTGLEFAYKQSLTFLPKWARGVSVFANASAQRATGDETNALNSYIPRTYNWGFSLHRPKYNAHVNWNYRGKHRRGLLTGASVEPGTYQWGSKRLYVDVSFDYYLSKRLGFFANFRNLTGEVQDIKAYGPNTPEVARFESRGDYGGIWSFGVKGSF